MPGQHAVAESLDHSKGDDCQGGRDCLLVHTG